MYAFKESGKFYDKIEIDLPEEAIYILKEKLSNNIIDTPCKDMIRIFISLNIILMDPTCTIKYNLFDKDRNFEITNCSIHMNYDNAKVAQYVITLNKVKL